MRESWRRLSRGKKLILGLIAGALVVGAVVGIVLAVLPDDSDRVLFDDFYVLTPIDQAFNDLPTGLQTGDKLGYDDAPVKLIQFEDFQCSHCLTHTQHVEPALVEEYVRSGVLQIEFRHFPVVGRESVTAAVGGVCAAEQNRLFEYANRLFVKQTEDGFRVDKGSFSEEELVEVAEFYSLDVEAFTACQADPATLDVVARDEASARAFGFRGTPSFVLSGTPVENPPQTVQGWRDLIHDSIEELDVGCPNSAETEFLAETSAETHLIGSALGTLGVYFEQVGEDPSLLFDGGWLPLVWGALSDIRTGSHNIQAIESPLSRSEPVRAHLLSAVALYLRGVREIEAALLDRNVDKLIQGGDALGAGGEAMGRATEALEKMCR